MKFIAYTLALSLFSISLAFSMHECSARWLSDEAGQTAEEILQQIADFAAAKKDAPGFWMKITSDPGDSLKYLVLVTKHNQYEPLSIQIASTNAALISYVLASETRNFGYHIKIEEPLEIEFLR